MTSKQLYLVLVGVISLLSIGLVVGAYGANNLLTSRADKLTTLKAKSQALSQEQVSFVKAKKDIKTYSDLKNIAKAVVPQDKDQAAAVREIVNIAAANGIRLASINFPASTLGAGTVTASGTATPASAAPPAAAAGSSKAGSLSQLQAVKNIPGVYQLIITVQGDPHQPVPYSKFVSFLSALEHNRRTAQVNTITIQPDANNRSLLTFALSLSEYIKP